MKRVSAMLSLVLPVAFTGCTASQSAAPNAAPTVVKDEITRYAPFESGTVFSYETYIDDTNERGLAVFEIQRPRADLVELSLAGQVRKRYYVERGGLRSAHGGYLLKSPLELNAEWRGDDGTVKVTDDNLSVTVPAGKFSGCLRTVEDARLGAATRKTTTVFCPGVGITVLEINAEQEGLSVLERLELKTFGPRFKTF